MWKQISGWPYEVSDAGEVRRIGGRVLKPMWTGSKRKQYATVCLRGKPRVAKKVHHLVLEAFVGPSPAGMIGLHRNDDTKDNSATNLYWGTWANNAHDSARKNGSLTHIQAAEIRRRRSTGERGRQLAREFGVSEQFVCDIYKGRSYHWSATP